MKSLQNWKIGSWLFLGFSIILLLVVLQGVTSYRQTNQLSQQTQTMYNHPLRVRRSIDNIKLELYELRLQFRNLILADDAEAEQIAKDAMIVAEADIITEFEVIQEYYLGPFSDVSDMIVAYNLWIDVRDDNLELLEDGELDQVLESIAADGAEAEKRDMFLEKILVIDQFAQNKSDELLQNATDLQQSVVQQLLIIVSALFLFTVLIGVWLYNSFRRPLSDMNKTVLAFLEGDMKSRVQVESTNELGTLAKSINEMAEVIESNEELHRLTNEFSDVLISENVRKDFVNVVLKTLMDYTNSVATSMHLLNDRSNSFELFESIGFEKNMVQGLKMDKSDGEFGSLLIDKTLKITNMNISSSFVYNNLAVGVIPKEIMSIPLVSENRVIAIITVANLHGFSTESIELVETVLDNLTARTEAVLANERINEFVVELEQRSNELVSQNAELELQKKQLNEASKLKSNFLSNMSHELRTPLNSVIALSGVLYERLKDEIPDEEYSYLEIIGRNGKHLLSLINDILDISRIESGRVEVNVVNFNVKRVVNEVLSMFVVEAAEKGISLTFENQRKDIHVDTDYDKCVHIVQNLVSNAVKFTQDGEVKVKTIDKKDRFEIIVTDTGIGISKSNIAKIFEEFKQAESGTARRFGGTGLGLSIAKRYANMLMGDLTVSSEEGKGSSFTLVLPKKFSGERVIETNIIDEKQLPENYVELSEEDPFEYTKTVLLIDDNEAVVIQVKDLIQGMGIKLLVANNGIDGLELINNNRVDGIILDLMMPDMDGFSVLNELRQKENTENLPVLVLTAKHITKKDMSTLKRNNIHQLIQKGDVDRVELQKAIFTMLFKPKLPSKKISRDKSIKILMVEDNPDNRTTLRAILRDVGEIFEAEDGLEGVKMATKIEPDIILMDIALPKMSGIEAFHKIRTYDTLKQVPIIAVTASALESEKANVLSHGFSDFIAKPVSPSDLIETIERVLYDD